MTQNTINQNRENLAACQDALGAARQSGDQRKTCIAVANLGLVYCQLKKFSEGFKNLNESINIAKELEDFNLQVQCLGMKTLAYQISEHLSDAFKVTQEVQNLAEKHGEDGILCDAIANQGQILLDSGDQISALEKFKTAQKLAETLEDKHRLMKILGALGHFSLVVAAPKQAENYFTQAMALADELDDSRNKIGFMGNLGTIKEAIGDYAHAEALFIEVLESQQATDSYNQKIQVLRHLTQIYNKQNNTDKVLQYGQMGIELAQQASTLAPLVIYEAMIETYLRLDQMDKAIKMTQQAIEAAHHQGEKQREVTLLRRLAESYVISDELEAALETYQKAQKVARSLNHHDEEAHIIGRTGVVLAELGRVDEAIHHHNISVRVAQEMNLKELESEQLTMLAIIYLETGELEQAKLNAEKALAIYNDIEAEKEANQITQLIAQINDSIAANL